MAAVAVMQGGVDAFPSASSSSEAKDSGHSASRADVSSGLHGERAGVSKEDRAYVSNGERNSRGNDSQDEGHVAKERPSVFTRLGNRNFSDVIGKPAENGLSFFPSSIQDPSVAIPMEMAREATKSFRTTIFGYFLGQRMHFPIVQSFVKTAWGKYGFKDAMMNENGTFFFKFNDEGGCQQVIEKGPIMIRGVPLFVFPWDPSKGVHKPAHDTCPLWIKLHNIPLVAFNVEGISRIASALGKPKQMDSCTSSMCEKQWGRPGFAKVLVEVFALGSLKREVEVLIPDLNGGPDTSVKVGVEYLWEPSQCHHCKVFGHTFKSCAKASVAKGKEKVNNTDEEGFTKVWKNKWRRKQGNSQGNPPPKGVDIKQPEKSMDNGKPVEEPCPPRDDHVIPNNASNKEMGKENFGGESVQPQRAPTMGVRDNGSVDSLYSSKDGVEGTNEGGQGKYDSKTPGPFLADIVKTYRTITRAKRGTFIDPITSNRFSALDEANVEQMGESNSNTVNVDHSVLGREGGAPSTSNCQ